MVGAANGRTLPLGHAADQLVLDVVLVEYHPGVGVHPEAGHLAGLDLDDVELPLGQQRVDRGLHPGAVALTGEEGRGRDSRSDLARPTGDRPVRGRRDQLDVPAEFPERSDRRLL